MYEFSTLVRTIRALSGLCGCVSAINTACFVWRWDLHFVNTTLLETTARSDFETRWKIQMSDRQLWSICTSPIAGEVTYKYCGNVPDTIQLTLPVRTVICCMTVQGEGEEQVFLLSKCGTDGTFKVTGFGKKIGCFFCQKVTTPSVCMVCCEEVTTSSVCMLWLWGSDDIFSLYALAVMKWRRLQSVCCGCDEVTTPSVCMLWLWWSDDIFSLYAVAVMKWRRLQSVCCGCDEVTTPSVCMLWLWWSYDAYILFCVCQRTAYYYLYFSWLICTHRYHSYHVPSVLHRYNLAYVYSSQYKNFPYRICTLAYSLLPYSTSCSISYRR